MSYYPLSGVFTESGGVCKPSNSSTLAQYKAMQTQLNRVATVLSLSKIGVDGDIGPGTLRLLSNISSKLYNTTMPFEMALANAASSQCGDVASDAVNITYWAKWTADARGAGSGTTTPTPKPPSGSSPPIIPPGGVTGPGTAQPQIGGGLWDAFKNLSTLEKGAVGVGLFAAGVMAGFIPFGKKKRGGSTRRA